MTQAKNTPEAESNARREREARDNERGHDTEQERELEKVEKGSREGRDQAPSGTGRPADTPWLGGG